MKVRFYCDSGANIYSEKSEIIDIEEYGYSCSEWLGLSDDEKMKEVEFWAWENGLDMGWVEVE